MLSFKVMGIALQLFIVSIAFLIRQLVILFTKSEKDHKFFIFGNRIMLLINAIFLIWLLLNKEAFHWNFDIATGEPVDHYSTYGRCFCFSVISASCSFFNVITNFLKKK